MVHSHVRPSSPSQSAPSRSTHLKLLSLTSGLVGIQFSWAVQVGYVTKALLELGLAQRFVSYAWLAGPIAGMLVQPIVGVWSDRCTSRLGRRKPFLIAGTVMAAVCLLLFAYAAQIGGRLGDEPPEEGKEPHQPRALVVAILAFWALDFAINAAQGPLRALLADNVPPEQHKLGNSYFALATGLGNCFGSLLGSVSLALWFPVFSDDLQALYTMAAIVLIIFMGITIVFVKEKPLPSTGYMRVQTEASDTSPVTTISSYDSLEAHEALRQQEERVGFFKAATIAPYPFFQTFAVQCFAWFGWFSMFVFATSWVGAEVYNGRFDAPKGSPERELYDAGVREGNLGIGLQSVLTIVSSLLLPSLLKRFSVQSVYFAAHVLLGTALTSALFLHHIWQAKIATFLLASTGFSWAVTMTIPWSLMSEAVAKAAPELAGIYFTMFNLSQCIPEILVSLVAEEVERITKSQAAVLGLGGITVYIAGVLTITLGIGKRMPEDENDSAEVSTLSGSDPSNAA